MAVISGDLTQLEAAIASAKAKLSALGADLPASGIDSFAGRAKTAVQGVEAPINNLSASFTNMGQAASAGFNQVSSAGAAVGPVFSTISAEAQALGGSVVTAGQAASNGLGQVAAAAEVAGKSVSGNGNAAAAALGNVATAASQVSSGVGVAAASLGGLSQTAGEAAGSVSQLALRKAELMTQLANVSSQLRSETSVMIDAQNAARTLGGSSAQLNQVYSESQTKVAELAVKQQLLKNELGSVGSALKAATTAQQAANVVQGVAATTTEGVAQKTGILSALMTTHTSQISSQGTAWKGYDNVVQAVIRSMGGIPVVWALAITVGGVLLEKLISMAKAKKDLASISAELVRNDLALADVFWNLQSAADGTNQVLNKQAELYGKLVEVDLGGLLASFATHFDDLRTKSTAAAHSQEDFNAANERASSLIQNLTSDNERAAATAGIYAGKVKGARDAEAEANAEREKASQLVQKDVEALADFIAATGRSVQSLLQDADASRLDAAAHAELEARLLQAASAQEQLNSAARNYRPPRLDSTLQTYDQLRTTINANAADLEKAGRTQGEILIALKPQLEALKKATIEKAAADLTSAGSSLKSSAAQKVLNDELKKGGDKAAEYGSKLPALDKNIKALSSTTEGHARAAGGARAAVSQYAEGVIGLGKAFDTVANALSSGTFSRLFDELPAKARKGMDQLKQAAQQVVKELDDLLKRRTTEGFILFDDKSIKISVAALEGLGAAGVLQMKRLAEGSKAVQEELNKIALAAVATEKPVFEIATHLGAFFDPVQASLSAAGEKLVAVADKFGARIHFNLASLAIDLSAVKPPADAAAEAVEEMSNRWVQSLGQAAKGSRDLDGSMKNLASEAPHWAGPIVDAARQIKDAILDSAEVIRTRAALDINQSFDSIMDDAIRLGQQMGKTGDDLVKFATESMAKTVAELKAKSPELASTIEAAAREAVERFQKEFYKLPGALDDIFNKLAVGAKKQMSGIFEIIGALPGKFGDALRKTTNTVLDWINRIDGILKGLHKIFNSIPEGLSGVIQQIIGVFRGSTAAVQASVSGVAASAGAAAAATAAMAASTAASTTSAGAAWDSLANKAAAASSSIQGSSQKAGAAVDAMSKQTASGTQGALSSLGKYVAGVGGALAGISQVVGVFGSGMGRVQGGLQGALGGATAGASIGFMAGGPVGAGIGAIIGGVGGLIAGIFGGGKTALQKAQEAAQLQQAKDAIKISQQNVLKAVEETKQSMIETLDKARTLLESIEFYSHVPKISFQAFFKDVEKLFNNMLDLARDVAGKASADVKAAAENLRPVVELFALIPQVLEGISAHLKVPDIQFDKFFADTKTLIEHLGVLLEEIPKELVKHAKKFQKALGDGLQVVPDLVTALASLFDIKSVSDQKLDIFESSLRKLTERISKIADETDKHLIKAVAFFGEKMGAGVALMKDAVDLVRALVDLPMPSEADFDHLFKSMEIGLSRAIESALAVVTDNLPLAQAIWEKTQTIVEVLKGGIEFVKSLVGIPMPSPDDFSNLFSGLNTGLNRAIEIALSIGEEALASAQAVWNRTKEIFDAVKAGVDVVKAIAETKWPEGAAWDAFLAAIDKMLTTLTASLGKMVEGQTVAAQMAAAARAIATDVAAAASSLASASGGFAGIGGGLAPGGAAAAFAGGFGATSIPAGPVSFGRTAAAAPVQETTQIFLTVEGSLVHERRIQDLLIESLRAAERRGRVSIQQINTSAVGQPSGRTD